MALQRNLFRKRLKSLETDLGLNFSEDQEEQVEQEDEKDQLSQVHPTQDIIDQPLSVTNLPTWSDYFDHNDIYYNDDGYCFQTYYKEPKVSSESTTPIILVGHHGAGSNALTFAQLSSKIAVNSKNYNSIPGFFTFDIRGHGNTNLLNKSGNYELPITQLIHDFKFLLDKFISLIHHKYETCHIFLIGHSLGGSILTKYTKDNTDNPSVKGLILLDIVEETAINALPHMPTYLLNLPTSFKSVNDAIHYYKDNAIVNSLKSCQISIPGLITKHANGQYVYIIDLLKTQPFWNAWFLHMSDEFTSISNNVSKMLVLSNNDYLDKALIVGQMQGKYQLIVFRSTQHRHHPLQNRNESAADVDSDKISHFLQEDIPNKLSISVLEFIERNDNLHFFKNDENEDEMYKKLNLINKLNKKWNVNNKE